MARLAILFFIFVASSQVLAGQIAVDTKISINGKYQEVPTIKQQLQKHLENGTLVSAEAIYISKALWSQIKVLSYQEQNKIIAEPNSYIGLPQFYVPTFIKELSLLSMYC